MSKVRPPILPTRFLQWYCKPQLLESIQGDLEEQYEEDLKNYGRIRAGMRFTWTVIRFFRSGIIKTAFGAKLNYLGMFKNYFITSIRFIKREKTFAFMNIAGLALGIACAVTIYKILSYELSYNKHNEQYDHIYRVNNEDVTSEGIRLWRGQVHPLAEALRNDFPMINATMTFYDKDGLIGIDDGKGNIQRYQENEGITFVEPQFFEIFSIQFLHGKVSTALDKQGKVIVSRSKAKKYFGLGDHNLHEAIGRSILLENRKTVTVSAVMENLPKTSDFPFEVLFHYNDQDVANQWFYEGKSWGEYNSATNCYVLLKDIDAAEFEKMLVPTVKKYLPEFLHERRTYRLQPLSDLHHSDQIRKTYAGITSTKEELFIIGLVGLFLIITACINFVNLSTAQAVKRSKEVGVRKTMGSSRRQLVLQFLCETFLITLLATVVGCLLASFLVDAVADILSYQMSLDLTETRILYFLGFIVVFVTLFAGLYPSFILARMNPVLAIKNSLNVKQTSGFLSLRRGLVILQFAISQILIIGVMILNAQMNYFKSKDLGFNEESILTIKLPERDSTNLAVLKHSLLSHSSIRNVSFGSSAPMASWRSTNPIFHPNIEGEDHNCSLKTVDADYFETYEMEFAAGEVFNPGDPRENAVVNRRLTETLGFQEPEDALGERVKYGRGSLEFVIVGVVEDFHAASLHADLENVIMANVSWNIFQAGIKLKSDHYSVDEFKEIVGHIESAWSTSFPAHVFDFEFYDDHLATYYELEESVTQVMRFFVIVSIIIGALGLYGLVAFMANKKTKEIGIRKVMGASDLAIWNIFSKELLTLLTIAFFISGPVSYYLMRAFLNTYAYRIDLSPDFFVLAVVASMVIALLTVGYKSMKIARANPVDSLKDE